ncbi:MAG TPA: dienelactone hydrolase family protein [Candidatus Acidoferrum sp.]|nr:dienelactone hydrolase family protein [Candidatus Acidoferrum sp.]
MKEQNLEIQAPAGVSEAVFFCPEGQGPWPGVIHLTDIGGIRPSQNQMAQRLAGEGYAVLMPNVFYRTARLPVMDSATRASDELRMKRIAELSAGLPPEAMEEDADAYVKFLESQESVGKGVMGVVGYCFTGTMAIRTAAARPGTIAAAASFHGGRLCTEAPTSPHLSLPRIKARLYFGHAVNDRSMPQEAIERFNLALDSWGGKYESEIYEGAYHSWTVPDSPVYNHPQAERAFKKLQELLAETLR